jgi:hypothetical protein
MLSGLSGHLLRDRSGTALIEFAIVLPLLLTLFIGGYVCADMIASARKVTVATRALADLVSRNVSPSSPVTSATLTTYLNSAQLVMTPMPASLTTLQITELRLRRHPCLCGVEPGAERGHRQHRLHDGGQRGIDPRQHDHLTDGAHLARRLERLRQHHQLCHQGAGRHRRMAICSTARSALSTRPQSVLVTS